MAESLTPSPPAPAPPGEPSWDVLALVAVATALFLALSAGRRKRALEALEKIAADWERAPDLGGLRTVERFIRPLIGALRELARAM